MLMHPTAEARLGTSLESLLYEINLPQAYSRLLENCGRRCIHRIRFRIDHLAYPALNNLDCTPQTWASNRSSLSPNSFTESKRKERTHVLQYKVPPIALPLPASNNAFSSACKHKHSCMSIPLLTSPAAELHLGQPPSAQLTIPLGVPLYPVDMTVFLSLINTAPTRRFMQLDRREASSASVMK